MEQKIIQYIYDCFSELVEKFGLTKVNEVNVKQFYLIEYHSNDLIIKIEKYRNEFYTNLSKTNNPDNEINLFNLLRYLNKDFTEFEYFYGEFHSKNELLEYYRNQIHYTSSLIYENFEIINDFFSSGDYKSKITELGKFMQNKYPELFKRF